MDGVHRSQRVAAEGKIETVLATGATAIFSAETIEPSISTPSPMRDVSSSGAWSAPASKIARASGATMCDHLDDADASMLGAFQP